MVELTIENIFGLFARSIQNRNQNREAEMALRDITNRFDINMQPKTSEETVQTFMLYTLWHIQMCDVSVCTIRSYAMHW